MGTAKRERQKVNRQLRLEQLQKEQRRQRTKRRILTWGIIVVLAGGALYGISLLVNRDSDSGSASADTTAATSETSIAPSTTVFQPTTVPGATITADTPCPAADGTSPRTVTFAKPPPTCIDPAKTYTATVATNKGQFTIALDPKQAPQNVNNFVVLARYHYYDGVLCHRIITDFVVQCGDPTGTGSGPNPGYTVPDELPAAGAYQDGSLAMANTGSPNTAGSQFFIITGEQGRALPAQYSLFGKVADGYDTTVKAIAAESDPNATNGTPTLEPVYLQSVTISES